MSIRKFVFERTFHTTDEALRKYGRAHIYYGDNTYNRSVKHINELFAAAKEDFPHLHASDVEVYEILPTQSDCCARCTMLDVTVSPDVFIQMRNNKVLQIM